MFQYDISDKKHYAGINSKREAYSSFLNSIGEDESRYPYTLDGLINYKGKPSRFTVTSWGGYFNADNQWTVFVAYRCNAPKHTIQHSWSWSEEEQRCYNHRVMEFIN